jgi:hypothetical protein
VVPGQTLSTFPHPEAEGVARRLFGAGGSGEAACIYLPRQIKYTVGKYRYGESLDPAAT